MNRRTETVVSLAIGVLAGSAVLVGLATAPFESQPPTPGAVSRTQPMPALFLSIEADQGSTVFSQGMAPPALGTPRAGQARLHWTVQDWRCARSPSIESLDLMPWRLTPARLELSTRVPETF